MKKKSWVILKRDPRFVRQIVAVIDRGIATVAEDFHGKLGKKVTIFDVDELQLIPSLKRGDIVTRQDCESRGVVIGGTHRVTKVFWVDNAVEGNARTSQLVKVGSVYVENEECS
ncbi:hypothetical protein CPT_Muldoon_144 [Serratia phage Muldoon]|uniref:Uncharacterized protein n=1 Tax=Serratia phage Muldoon TaxID=2601678 RepID=A0A5P8PHG0_9CAUD|nr:hypothetical protein HYP94_gp246 [Serratia phage Muldoon]QFR56095.1 hypothetical protein CPT_Muldoon_144 [Serratia phage Muldoon]